MSVRLLRKLQLGGRGIIIPEAGMSALVKYEALLPRYIHNVEASQGPHHASFKLILNHDGECRHHAQ